MSIGFALDDGVDNWDTGSYNSAEVINDFVDKSVHVGKLFDDVHTMYSVSGENCTPEFDSNTPDLIYYSDGYGDTITINATMIIPEDARYIINIRGNYLENIIYCVNDAQKASGRYQTQLMDLGDLKAGDIVRFTMEFSEDYSPEGSVSMFLSTLNKDNLSRFRGELQKREMIVTEMTDNTVKGTVHMEKNQLLFTTIPYDEGWRAYIDGEEYYPEETGDGFLCLWLDEGEHDIELKFIPEGMKAGILLSVIGWLLFIIMSLVIRKNGISKSEKNEASEEASEA